MINGTKELAHKIRVQMTAPEALATEEDRRPTEISMKERAEISEDCLVVSIVSRIRCHERRPVGSPSGPTAALLVIGSSGRNISQHHTRESTDINAEFQCRGGAQDIAGTDGKEVLQSPVFFRVQLRRVLFRPDSKLKGHIVKKLAAHATQPSVIIQGPVGSCY
jgi:hypothetical protein